MDTNESNEDAAPPPEANLPRWIQIPAGLLLSAILLPCLAGSLAMVFLPNDKAPLLAPAFGVLMTVVCVWGLGATIRLIIGKRVHGGLFGPISLRVIGWFFLLLPLGGLFTGYFMTHTIQALVQTAAYIGVFFGLRAMAKARESHGDHPLPQEYEP